MRASKPIQRSILIGLTLFYQELGHAQLPTGGSVVGGAATINNQDAHNQVINQTTNRAIIDWQDFSIGAGNSVRINQLNSSSILLNRVTGGNPSNILGSLSANGQVFLVNPFGVYFGAGASIDVGGLVATTMNIRNDDFMSGNYVFSHDTASAIRREVINAGVIKARQGGYVVLAGDYAANSGVIQARLGTAALASGNQMTLDINGDSLINFTVNEKTVAALSGVDNSGQLLADGGRAIMTASVANNLAAATVNNSGLVQAQTTVESEGAIYLSADGGNTLVSGTLDASGKAAGQQGGSIKVLGDQVALVDNARLDASGDAGGGNINVGGSYQGQGPLPNARTAYVGGDVKINADALNNGNGGNAVIWSDENTRYFGDISARGGAQGGDGGNVEISGKAVLNFSGTANTLAPQGKAGSLLLDPSDIEILTTVNPATADMTASSPFSDATDNGGTSQMTVAALETALAGGNVTVSTSTSSGTAPKGGSITIDDGSGGGVQWSTANTLHLQANNQIILNSTVEGYSGTLWLDATGGAVQKAGTVLGANGLLLTGSGNWDLAGVGSTSTINSWNKVNTFAANINGGLLRFSNNQGFTVGSVAGTNGITQTGGNTQLYIDKNNGVLTLAQGISSNDIYMRAQGGITQTGGSITGSTMSVAGGTANLNRSGNNLGTISANVNGSFTYTDTDRVTVGSVFGVNGITTNNNNVTLSTGDAAGYDKTKLPDGTNPASLTLNEIINAGTGTVQLTAGSGGVYQRRDLDPSTNLPLAAGSITASNLVLRGSSGSVVSPFVLNNANNLVGTLAASTNGSVSYTGGPLTVGTVNGTVGITTTSNTIVVPHGVDASGNPTPDVYNDNNVSLSVGGDMHINQNINAATANGSGAVTIGIGGDFTASTATGKRIDANTLGVFGDDLQGTFNIVSNASSLAAAGGKVMVIDNSAFTGDLTAIGLGAPAANASATSGSSTVSVDSASKPIGDFYLTTGGGLNIIKLNSKGSNLMLRSNSLNILLDATTADKARIMLQPYNLSNRIGINNSTETGFTADTNYDAATLLKFTNPTATFFVGTPQDTILQDTAVPSAAKNTLTGDIHIGSDGAFNLGYRSLSAETSGNLVAYNVGPLYNLRLVAPNLTINSFTTIGDQIHLFTNNLSLPGSSDAYVNPNKPTITIRPLNDETIWVGYAPSSKSRPLETQLLSTTIQKLPDYSTVVISGSTDYPFPNGGPGYGDIHIPWDDGFGDRLGHRKLILSTGSSVYTYSSSPVFTQQNNGGTSGGLWLGCQDLTTCQGTNPSPYPDPTPNDNNSNNNNSNPGNTSDCIGCPPAPKDTNPYPPDNSSNNGNSGNNGGGNNGGNNGTGNNDAGTGGGDGGAGTGSGGTGDGTGSNGNGSGNGVNGNGNGDGGAGIGTGGNGTGDGTGDGGAGTGGGGTGDGTSGIGNGSGNGDGGAGAGTGGNGNGNGTGDGGAGTGSGGTGNGGAGDGSGNGGNGNGNGTGDGGAGTGSGGTGNGGAGDGSGNGGNGNGNGDGGAGTSTGGNGNGDGSGDGGAGTGSGGTSNGGAGKGSGIGGNGNGDDGSGTGGGGTGNGAGDSGAGTASGGTGDGADGNTGTGTGIGGDGKGDGNGGAGNGNGDGGADTNSGGTSNGNSSDDGSQNTNTPSDTFAPSTFDISCNDMSAGKDEKDTDSNDTSAKDQLIKINGNGLKMHDPCQKSPEQRGKK